MRQPARGYGSWTTEPRWLDPDEALAWRQLLAVIEHLPAAIDAQLKRDAELGRFEHTVLAVASGSPDRTVAMLELSRLTHGSLSRLSHTVSRMEARGLGVVIARLELELGGAIGAAGLDVSVRLGGDRLTVVALGRGARVEPCGLV
jgi:hypothetical protein